MQVVDTEEQVLREELLDAAQPEEIQQTEPPKKNTKLALLNKILEVSEKGGIPLQHSNSKLKRMNKQQLAGVLADVIEEGMRKKMARQVGCDEDSDSRTIALGALRMLHDVCALGVQQGGSVLLEPKGYQIEGFAESLKEPTVSRVIDGCLAEIAEENQEILEYIQSPYARLGIAWAGALAFCVKKKDKDNAALMGPRPSRIKNPVRGRGRGRPSTREINSNPPPAQTHVKEV
jgi:hypothetical protein